MTERQIMLEQIQLDAMGLMNILSQCAIDSELTQDDILRMLTDHKRAMQFIGKEKHEKKARP
jgi:hypothetical protein